MRSNLGRRQFLRVVGSGGLIVLAGRHALGQPTSSPTSNKRANAVAGISKLATASDIAKYNWADRGRAPAGYIKGMAVSYAKTYHELKAGDLNVVEMARAMGDDGAKDALQHYHGIFQPLGMDNSKTGADTLRHLFVLMLGLGMRESSGRYCEGRDRSADNTTSETAEAGLFQTSYNARRANPLLPALFDRFKTDPTPSYLEIFKEGVRPKDDELENFGEGDGREFQRLSKACPFFALQFAAIALRNLRKHWGPINRKAAEIRPEADTLFKEVQVLVDTDRLGSYL